MARKKYKVIGGVAATKVIDLSPKPVKAAPKVKPSTDSETTEGS